MTHTHQTQITCHRFGYLLHLATNCIVRGNTPRRVAQNPLNQNPRKIVTQNKKQEPKHLYKNFQRKIRQNYVLFFL